MDLNQLAEISYRIYDDLTALRVAFPEHRIERIAVGDLVVGILTEAPRGTKAAEVSVVFRGTKAARTVFRDLDIWFCKFGAGRAHEGFAKGLTPLWPEIFDRLVDLPPTSVVNFGGHSFGAAVAGLAAYKWDVARDQSPELTDIRNIGLFGCPRFCDIKLRDDYNRRLGDRTFRVVNESDPVTLIPLPGIPWLPIPFLRLPYRHVGKFSWLMRPINGATLFRRRTDWISWLNVSRKAIGNIRDDILGDHGSEEYYKKLDILARQTSPRSVRDTLYPELQK